MPDEQKGHSMSPREALDSLAGDAGWAHAYQPGDTAAMSAELNEAVSVLEGLIEQLGAAHDEINERSDSQALMLGKLKELQEQKEAADRVLAVADQLAEWVRVTVKVEGVFSNNIGAQAQAQGLANLLTRYAAARDSYPAKCPDCKGMGATDTETGMPCQRPSSSCEECFTCGGTGKVSSPARRPEIQRQTSWGERYTDDTPVGEPNDESRPEGRPS